MRIQTDLLQCLDHKQCCFLVLLDLSAAFDTVNHAILIERWADRFGIRDNASEWIKSYLSGRTNCVTINKSRFKSVEQHCNVPHGSVLGPTFFSDYIAPLDSIFRKWVVPNHLYADDTHIYMPFTPGIDEDVAYDKLTKCIQEVRSWMAKNFLKLNDDKTDFLIVGNNCFLSRVNCSHLTIGDV